MYHRPWRDCCANERSNQAIADALIIAAGTSERYICAIFGKLGVTSRAETLVRTCAFGLVRPRGE